MNKPEEGKHERALAKSNTIVQIEEETDQKIG